MTNRGIVSVCDILGYQNIIDNNQIERTATLIRETLQDLPALVGKELDDAVGAGTQGAFAELTAGFEYLVFSDTVLLALPIPDTAPAVLRDLQWHYFLTYLGLLLRTSFDRGLPMRGGVGSGEYSIIGNSFAGHAIIDALRQAQELDFAGAALTPAAGGELASAVEETGNLQHFRELVFPYLAPLKEERTQRLLLLNWFAGLHSAQNPEPSDVRQYIINSFAAHNKDIPRTVFDKIDNTEMILRYPIDPEWQF